MVLIGKIISNNITCLLFKMRGDTLNVFMACPYHVIKPNDFKIKIQILGNEISPVTPAKFATVLLFPVQHIFLNLALGVIQEPEIINDVFFLRESCYFTYNANIYENINSNANILSSNKSGGVISLPAKITDINYELGMLENIELTHKMPFPGGFIKIDREADIGLSGSILVNNNNVIGLIVISSSISNYDTSWCLATDMFYLYPHIVQCTTAIHKFTNNNPIKLELLKNYNTFQTLNDDLLPIVNHLGGSFIFNQISNFNPIKNLTIIDIHNYMLVNNCLLTQENISNSISIKTTLNTNHEFMNYFFEKQQNSQVQIISAKYYDKFTKEWIMIDFENDPILSNILDWCFRGDPLASLYLTVNTRTLNNDGTITISKPVLFTFFSSPTVDTIYNTDYPRTTIQIPSPYFNKMNSKMIMNSFGLNRYIHLNWLNYDKYAKQNADITLFFENNEKTISEKNKNILNKFFTMNGKQFNDICITGHTDSIGCNKNCAENRRAYAKFGYHRANETLECLKRIGVKSNKFRVCSSDYSEPFNNLNHNLNRRVSIYLS